MSNPECIFAKLARTDDPSLEGTIFESIQKAPELPEEVPEGSEELVEQLAYALTTLPACSAEGCRLVGGLVFDYILAAGNNTPIQEILEVVPEDCDFRDVER